MTGVVQVAWLAVTLFGVTAAGRLTRDAHQDLARARDEGDETLILTARAPYRLAAVMTAKFAGFFAAGVTGVAADYVWSQPLIAVTRLLLLGSVTLVAVGAMLSLRDMRRLQRLIRADVLRRLSEAGWPKGEEAPP